MDYKHVDHICHTKHNILLLFLNVVIYVQHFFYLLTLYCISRFPLNNPKVLGKWEKAVREINNDPDWNATGYTYICSNHFCHHEYIIHRSEDVSCRLKSTAVPTILNLQSTPLYGIPKILRKKIEHSCNLKVLTTLSPVDIFNHDHTQLQNRRCHQQASQASKSLVTTVSYHMFIHNSLSTQFII